MESYCKGRTRGRKKVGKKGMLDLSRLRKEQTTNIISHP